MLTTGMALFCKETGKDASGLSILVGVHPKFAKDFNPVMKISDVKIESPR
jgi:hypothetical protein